MSLAAAAAAAASSTSSPDDGGVGGDEEESNASGDHSNVSGMHRDFQVKRDASESSRGLVDLRQQILAIHRNKVSNFSFCGCAFANFFFKFRERIVCG